MVITDFIKWKLAGDGNVKGISIMSSDETLKYIRENQCSVCRYGDGELALVKGSKGPKFQRRDSLLASRLKKILASKELNDNILVCVPYTLMETGRRALTVEAKSFWERFAKRLPFRLYRIMYRKRYGDTQITRPYMDLEKTSVCYDHAKGMFTGLQALWGGKKVLIIEGEKTRLGVNNDLFVNCKSIDRVLCPAVNSWDFYAEIYNKVLKLAVNYEIILIALGPTATVLAYDLGKAGYWAIDIGHLDVEYEWFRQRAQKKIPLMDRYVNEAPSEVNPVEEGNAYYDQVICKIG